MSTAVSVPISTREEMILSHLPQVQLIALRIWNRCARQVELEDLVSEGVIGLMQAVDRYDPGRECLLKTLAEHRIRGAMLDYLRRLDPLSRSVRQFVRQRNNACEQFEHAHGRAPEELELAQALGMRIERYRKLDRTARQCSFLFERFGQVPI